MSQNKENNKTGRGFYTTSQLKRVVLNRYKASSINYVTLKSSF